MSRREVRERGVYPLPPPSKCAKVLYYTWKLCSVVFSHFVMISLVVAYCILGAVTFEKLEAQYEKEVKRNISKIRDNTTESIWSMTYEASVLNQTNWTTEVTGMLRDFENAILMEMKVRGWDGNESTDHIQWTFTGALFYSIIVITTIGYGHIAPKTQSGKVVTIFYAIIGIPLMLLCLSNIGDVMASSFRFLYWRVCCYVCTRPPPKRSHHHRAAMRRSARGNTVRLSVRRRRPAPAPLSAPAPLPAPLERSHSDTDCRYRDSGYSSGRGRRARAQPPVTPATTLPRTRSQPPTSYMGYGTGPKEFERVGGSLTRPEKRNHDTFEEADEEEFPKISLPLQDLEAALKQLEEHTLNKLKPDLKTMSLPRPPKSRPEYGLRREFEQRRHFDDDDDKIDTLEMHDLHDVDYENYKERKAKEVEERDKRRLNRDDFPSYSYMDRDRGYDPEDDDYEFDCPRPTKMWYDRDRRYRGRSEYYELENDDYFPERRGRRARSAMYGYESRWDHERDDRRDNWRDDRRDNWRDGRRDYWRDERRDNWRDHRKEDWRDDRRDVETGRKQLRRLQTVDDSRTLHRYTPSPDLDDWRDEVVVPRRSRPPATWGTLPSDMYVPKLESAKEEIKPVPIWLCVFLVASYIVVGTFLFKRWEGWAYLDAAYFCFITLTTIGFGDFVPAQGQFHTGDAAAAVHSIALCSLYLLFGIALLAMSFNLVQEEVRANVAALATKLGIIKPKDREESDEDY